MSFSSLFASFFKQKSTERAVSDVCLSGMPTLIVRDKDGKVLSRREAPNLVLNIGRNEIVRILTGDATTRIQSIELGTGGVGADPFVPIPPIATNTDLTTPLSPRAPKNITAFEYENVPTPTRATFSVIFEAFDIDAIVSEAVLKFSNGKVYARHTFPAVYLKADRGYSLEILWSIRFS